MDWTNSNVGKEWGWGTNAQLMENDPWGPADPVTLDSLDGTLRTMDWNLWTIDGDVRELVRRACHQARAARDQQVSPILVGASSSADVFSSIPRPVAFGICLLR